MSSTDVDVGKPDPVILEVAIARLGAAPVETWLIGDSLRTDVQGALNAGLGAAVWLNRHGHERTESDPEPHHEVESLQAFAALLDRYVI